MGTHVSTTTETHNDNTPEKSRKTKLKVHELSPNNFMFIYCKSVIFVLAKMGHMKENFKY